MLRYAALNHEIPHVIERVYRSGARVIVDYAKENCKPGEAADVVWRTNTITKALPVDAFCAIKLTSFGSREDPAFAKSCAENVIRCAKERGVRVCIDAEDVLYPEMCTSLMEEYNTPGVPPVVYKTYQMYRVGAVRELTRDIESGVPLGVKLVRGAYLRKQGDPVFPLKSLVDKSFRKGMELALGASNAHTIVATHNTDDADFAQTHGLEVAQLMGMVDRADYIYVPYGNLWELTPYLWRRFKERLSWT
jgi:hydroxyproline oxidase